MQHLSLNISLINSNVLNIMNDDMQISSLADQNVQITAREFGAKTRSKREIYRFL